MLVALIIVLTLGAVLLGWMMWKAGKEQNSLKTVSKQLKHEVEVSKKYEAINAEPVAPKRAVVKRLRSLSTTDNAVPSLPETK